MNFVLNNVLVGCAVFAGISIFARIPLIGWFGWLLALGAWIWLASRLVFSGMPYLSKSPDPRIPAMGWSALVGLVSGFAGALVSLAINMITMAGASHVMQYNDAAALTGLNASFGALRDIIGLFTRSAFGALVCGAAGLVFGGRANK